MASKHSGRGGMPKRPKEPVTLRQKRLANGALSLYLDIYHRGRRSYEFLRLYLLPGTDRQARRLNEETMRRAESIRQSRVAEIRDAEFGDPRVIGRKTPLFTLFDHEIKRREIRGQHSASQSWKSARVWLRRYEPDNLITLDRITPEWIEGFRDFLLNSCELKQNTMSLYFSTLRAVFNIAARRGLITRNPMQLVDSIPLEETTRQYLTIAELQQLQATPCRHAHTAKIFIFSCLTGLRISDIRKLTWGMVDETGEYTRLIFRQKKTRGSEYLDIAPQAAEIMGQRGSHDDAEPVFPHISHYPNAINAHLTEWVKAAGIRKPITFHCARHTFATMMLGLGADIYTVSKLLGHRNLSTTQIYAHLIDKKKQAAVDLIPRIINPQEDSKE